MRARIDDWRRHLIDLSFRNRLINFRPTRSSTLVLEAPSIHDLLADPDRSAPFDFYVPPEPSDPNDLPEKEDERAETASDHPAPRPDDIVTSQDDPNRLKKILENLARRSNGEFEDKGLRILHLAGGFLNWVDPVRKEELRSPLVLVPVELRRESPRHPYRLYFAEDDEIVINPALTIKLERDAGLEVPEDWVWEDKPLSEELDEIRAAIAGTDWSVVEDSVLGLFSFQKLVMYRDLLRNEERIAGHETVRSLASGTADEALHEGFAAVPDGAQLDESQDPRTSFSVLDADASQRHCIEAAKRGCSFVMHGPPGTGKSQTIANVIAEALGDGKRVLFISEKIAALDVVHKRLAQRGLGEFCLKLHGRDAGRREVVESLDQSLTSKTRPSPLMSEREMSRLVETRQRLNRMAALLHKPASRLLDEKLHDVYARLARLHAAPLASGVPSASALDGPEAQQELNALHELFAAIAEQWPLASDQSFAWRGYKGTTFTEDARAMLLRLVGEVSATAKRLLDDGEGAAIPLGLPAPASIRASRHLCVLGEHLAVAPALDPSWLGPQAKPSVIGVALEAAHAAHEQIASNESAVAARYPHRRVDDFPADIEPRLAGAVRDLDDAIGRTPAWDEKLAAKLHSLKAFVDDGPNQIDVLMAAGSELAENLGQTWGTPSPDEVDRLVSLADLAFHSVHRPDQLWLIPAGLTRARAIMEDQAPQLLRYQEDLERLSQHYSAEALELDAETMVRVLEEAEGKRLARLGGSYRSQVKRLRAVRTDGRSPDDPLADAREIKELIELGSEIDAAAPQRTQALGDWETGRDIDPVAVAEGLSVAEQAQALIAPDSDLQALASCLCVGSQGSSELAQLSATVSDLLGKVRSDLEILEELSGMDRPSSWVDQSLGDTSEALCDLQESVGAFAGILGQLADGRAERETELPRIELDAAAISAIHTERARVAANREEWARVLGTSYRGSETEWDRSRRSVEWLVKLHEIVEGEIPQTLHSKLATQETTWPDFATLAASADAYDGAVANLFEQFDAARAAELAKTVTSQPINETLQLVDRLNDQIDRLPEWVDYRRSANRIRERGWGEFADSLLLSGVVASAVSPAFERAYWGARLDRFFEANRDLEEFRGRSHERLIDEFNKLDKRLVNAATDRIIEVCNERRPAPVAVTGSEVALVRREAKKKRRHLPVRKLLERLPTVLPALKPCLMMSPLTVSHYLSPDHHFDLAVFDEASQVTPWDAINCIYRADQLIVAGDPKQLPPTPFFQLADPESYELEEDDESAEEVMESILDACETLLPSESLRWHYRSRHEHLISFSNHHFYSNKLVTFPAPALESDRLGVRLLQVEGGVYDRARSRTNRVEAVRVAQRVIEHLRETPWRSVGVVAFSVSQADAILDELDRLRDANPDLEEHFGGDRLESVFVKNLESVQGDERDVMIFSIGYAFDEHGKFHMGFGPLNKDGGHRRLNVAITRAREQVDVVSSVRASDFRLSETAAPGARLLQEYIRFADEGPSALRSEIESMGGAYESPFEEAVAEAVRDLGYTAIPQVGVGGFRIDLGVVDPQAPGRFALGIECDGATYHSTPTARDRDRLRQEVLERLGWRIHRIWSWDWVRERSSEVERLQQAIEGAIEAGHAEMSPAASETDVEPIEDEREREFLTVHEIQSAGDAADLPWVVTYERATLASHPSPMEFHEPSNRPRLIKALEELVRVEAPLHCDYAIKRMAEAQGISRRGSRVTAAGKQAIALAVQRGLIERRGDFLWRLDQEVTTVRTPDPFEECTRRDISEIAPEEIDLAITKLAEAGVSSEPDDLITQAARVLGFDRTGAEIRKVMIGRLEASAS